MNRVVGLLLVVLVVLVATIGIFGVITLKGAERIHTLEEELSREIAIAAEILESRNQALDQLGVALGREKTALESRDQILASAEAAKLSLKEVEEQFAVFQKVAAKRAIEEYERGLSDGHQRGLRQGYDEGHKEAIQKVLRNPTLKELKVFLGKDKTNEKPWTTAYSCGDFSTELNANAQAAGFRIGFVWVVWRWLPEGKWGHFMNAFELDSGEVVFVEPQTDQILRLEVGGSFMGETIKQILIAW